jgi:hypothetical protein
MAETEGHRLTVGSGRIQREATDKWGGVPQVIAMFLETGDIGISRRAGICNIEKAL